MDRAVFSNVVPSYFSGGVRAGLVLPVPPVLVRRFGQIPAFAGAVRAVFSSVSDSLPGSGVHRPCAGRPVLP